MKKINNKIQKTLIASLALFSASCFAVSSQTGLDAAGDGVIHISGTATGSCSTPTIPIDLGQIDFYTSANAPTGAYTSTVSIPVQCTNPSQNWSILPQTLAMTIASGSTTPDGITILGATTSDFDNYVSLTSTSLNPGALFFDDKDAALIKGVGTQTVTGKLVLGHSLPANSAVTSYTTASDYLSPANGAIGGAVPMGTIPARGAAQVDIPLQIMY